MLEAASHLFYCVNFHKKLKEKEQFTYGIPSLQVIIPWKMQFYLLEHFRPSKCRG